MKKRIALLAGGFSGESAVSMKSAKTILANLDTALFDTSLIEVSHNGWLINSGASTGKVDLNDFSYIDEQGLKVKFDYAYVIIHGAPGEDGKVQGYLDMMKVPYSTGSVLNMALTFNKAATQTLMNHRGIQVVKHMVLRSNDTPHPEEIVKTLRLPCFVKPTESGSSIGVSKVKSIDQLIPAIDEAMGINKEVIIESLLDGRELACGVYSDGSEVKALPVTEIIAAGDFFDYKAKYEDQTTQEITPAPISESAYKRCQEITKQVYEMTNCCGIARADFFLCGEELFLVEINTIPGMSAESIVPRQLKSEGIDLKELLTKIILNDLKRASE